MKFFNVFIEKTEVAMRNQSKTKAKVPPLLFLFAGFLKVTTLYFFVICSHKKHRECPLLFLHIFAMMCECNPLDFYDIFFVVLPKVFDWLLIDTLV